MADNGGSEYLSLPKSLTAFNDRLVLIEKPPYVKPEMRGPAEAWNRDQIIEFLDDVVKDPAAYGATDVDRLGLKRTLGMMRDQIRELSLPSGSDFEIPEPPQHISREWNSNALSESDFEVKKQIHSATPYWSPHDLLGLFLSKLGQAPPGAKWDNFYLPLMYVYGRWCAELASLLNKGVGLPPTVVQCTWTEQPGHTSEMLLGASFAGYSTEFNTGWAWKNLLQRERYELLDSSKIKPWSFELSPLIEERGARGTRFGNCAETYAFATLFKKSDQSTELHGLALHKDGCDTYYDEIKPYTIFNPCENCKHMIRSYMRHVENFLRPVYEVYEKTVL